MLILIIILLLLLLLIWTCSKWFVYYCSTAGLMYYVQTKYGEEITLEKAKELRDTAADQVVKKLSHKD